MSIMKLKHSITYNNDGMLTGGSLMGGRSKAGWAKTMLLGALMLSGCTSLQQIGATPEEVVQQRAQQRLNALLKWDLDKAYSFVTPGYREMYSKRHYTSRYLGAINWQDAQVQWVSCNSAQRCKVSYTVTFKNKQLVTPLASKLEEAWVNTQGEWYLYLR